MDKRTFMSWLQAEIDEARGISEQFLNRSIEEDYDNLEHEIERHEQDGWVNAMEYIQLIWQARNG